MSHHLLEKLRQRAQAEAVIYPAVSPEDITYAEKQLGFKLPPLLVEIYTSIANGGFGPEYKILGLRTGLPVHQNLSAIAFYRKLDRKKKGPARNWPSGLLPFSDWGCAIYSCVDCTRAELPVLRFDPTTLKTKDPIQNALRPECASLQLWFEKWLDGNLPFVLPPQSS